MLEEILSSIQSIPSLISGLIGVILGFLLPYLFYFRKVLKHARLTSLSSTVSVERSLAEVPEAFRFHGISQADLDEAGITDKELAYLVANFTAGRIHDAAAYTMSNKPFDKLNYRYKMLEQLATRNAWMLILRMMTEDKYIRRLQKTKDKIEEEERKRCVT